MDPNAVKAALATAFADSEYPGDWCLSNSNEGEEGPLLAAEFKGKTDWRLVDAAFLDQAPAGYGSALSFFTDEAFRFYLPAYLTADIEGELRLCDPTFHLYFGLTDKDRAERVNPRRYGERTWFEAQSHRFAVFNASQAQAIAGYLQHKRNTDAFARESIDQALTNFWLSKASSKP